MITLQIDLTYFVMSLIALAGSITFMIKPLARDKGWVLAELPWMICMLATGYWLAEAVSIL